MSDLELKRTPGESGESGEAPYLARDAAWRTNGEGRRKTEESVLSPVDPVDGVLERARAALGDTAVPETPYPVEALGVLAPACNAIADGGQMAPEMAGQSLLAASALLAQSVTDVQTLAGTKPLSLYALTIADSGDGKSTAEKVALHPIIEHQRSEALLYRERRAESDRAKGGNGEKPEPPRAPYRIMRDGTVEGIRQSFSTGVPSQGLFTSEAAMVLSGYGMQPDTKAKTAGAFNALWDDGQVSTGRAGSGRLELYGQRLSMHWMIQPDAARSGIMDPTLSGIGFWPRFLLAWPPPAPPRKAQPFNYEQDPAIKKYWRICERMLQEPLEDDYARLPVLKGTQGAIELAGKFFERMDYNAKVPHGMLTAIRPYAARITEQAYRVAGVLAVVEEADAINADLMHRAISLVSYSLEAWRVVFGDREEAEARRQALGLINWMLQQPGMAAKATAISKMGPRATRPKHKRDTALALLEHAGLINQSGNRWEVEV
jgi:hypothetical protein